MSKNDRLTYQDLIDGGYDRETLDRIIAEYDAARGRLPEIPLNMEGISFEPAVFDGVMTWLAILGFRPAAINELERSVRTKIRLKKRDRAVIAEAARLAGPAVKAAGKRRLSLQIRVPKGQKRHDPDAFWKSLQDACVHAKLLVNDSPVWLDLGRIDYDPVRGPLRTTLILEDLPGGQG